MFTYSILESHTDIIKNDDTCCSIILLLLDMILRVGLRSGYNNPIKIEQIFFFASQKKKREKDQCL